ncbi:hypothetical protein [Pseudomonas putida]|uniref:hypothetical protein n=1 Tax=Pseudomonas putida TaxID=303 RepID=UPI003570BC22
MGYLRKKSFMIFYDPEAPTESKTLDPQEVAKIEALHEEGKSERIEELVRKTIVLIQKPRDLSNVMTDLMDPALVARIKQDLEEERLASPALSAEEITIRLKVIIQNVQDLSADQNSLNNYIRGTLPSAHDGKWRDFARAAYGIFNSKAELPDSRYIPQRESSNTVRFKTSSSLGIGLLADSGKLVTRELTDGRKVEVPDGQTYPALWVKIVEGWAREGDWGGFLQVTSITAEGQYIDSDDTWGRLVTNDIDLNSSVSYESQSGWAVPTAARTNVITFYDKGNYYEIWQGDRKQGRPLVVEGNRLKFVAGATPGKWNIQDATWS